MISVGNGCEMQQEVKGSSTGGGGSRTAIILLSIVFDDSLYVQSSVPTPFNF